MMTKNEKPISLYIHFPFCVKKCAYCAFFSVACFDESLLEEYKNAVIRRINSMPVFDISTVYFGGGTPTVLGSRRLCEILNAVFNRHKVDKFAEITLEANPGTVCGDDISSLRSCGFNRLSLGLQSANDNTLKLMGRIHNYKQFTECYSQAEKYFENISVDIIFALPNDNIDNTLKAVKAISPKHISAYSLTLEENTPLYNIKDTISFPTEDEEEEEYYKICSAFSDYCHYEISSFAKPGYYSKHNSVYWTRGDYIGIGPAAHSFYNNKRFFTENNIEKFIKASYLPFTEETNFSSVTEINASEAEEERIMLGLRLKSGASLNESQLKIARNFANSGYGEISGNVFALNDKGFRVSNAIIAEILK